MPPSLSARLPRHVAPTQRRAVTVRAAVRENAGDASPPAMPRRAALFGGAVVVGLAAVGGVQPARADDDAGDGFTTYFGTASPPTSYGGYGGNAKETAKYSFEYPTNWKVETIGKQQKGMVGIDAKVSNPRSKRQGAYVITFGRAGEDNRSFKLGDVEKTLEGFAGADYDLQDALTAATDKKANKRTVADGADFYDYEVVGPDSVYLASVTLKGGKVFALFVSSPAKAFAGDEAKLRRIVESFKTL